MVGALALVAGTSDAQAFYIPANAPYQQSANDAGLTSKLSSPGSSWWSSGSWWDARTPQLPGASYPGAWEQGQTVIVRAQTAARLLPALRVLGAVGLAVTSFEAGWKIGSYYVKIFGPIGTSAGGVVSGPRWTYDAGTNASTGLSSYWFMNAGVTSGCTGSFTQTRGLSGGSDSCHPGLSEMWNAFSTTSIGALYDATTPAGSRFKQVPDAQMESAVSRVPITATAYNAYPSAQRLDSGAYTAPVGAPNATDLANARAVMGAPVAGRNASGTYVDAAGNPLSNGQVIAQADANCSLDASYCAGGANDPAAAGGPLSDVAVMPTCTGAVVAVCVAQLDAAGFSGARTFTERDLNGADLTKPAGAIVTQDHASGSSVTKSAPLTFTINPGLADMPLVLPAPLISETHAAYLTRLQVLGYVGTFTSTDLSETTGLPSLGPNTIVRLQIGTTTTTQIETTTFPTSPVRLRKDAPISVQSNPATFTPVANAGAPTGGGGTTTGASTCDCTVRAIDWTPLRGLSAGDRFPFGLWSWLYGGIGGWASSGGAPAFDLPLYGFGAGKNVHVDLAPFGAIAALWRAALTVLVTVLAIWNFASRQAGDGDGEGL